MPTTALLPTYFISHGGGPWPYVPEMRRAMHALEQSLQDIPRQIGTRPEAVLVVSGHWEDDAFAVMSSPRPPMVYDYYGFPPHTYEVRYAAPGAPALAGRIASLIAAAGLPSRLDAGRGFDHGTFAPLQVMYPDADVPVVQVALQQRLDPAQHLALGRALAPLRAEGVLIVGSGLSYHNLRRFGDAGRAPSAAFDQWLQDALVRTAPADRAARLVEWESAPAARLAHPREDHLIPLMVAAGAAEAEPARCIYHEDDIFGGVTASSFRFG
ncbi:DODA-type extradiol aromatic ring-opening family dioxygenase [Paracidovorax konjaci]|uniref:Aromatic ring-opening dioxygenase, catalytic subunit, LigB family n=1 Tax=Paracidovorax konjaci TaxID=32040 RepID=A0A1I1UMN7_9BURK|nr:class III extradiol ring-cleavage dioxygenase [Paracidovorax konjaci]SFD72056.1 Aromatic ring-opening dioxygenase, catalytic subunit, LigB family [Paracidovorax konjaci]